MRTVLSAVVLFVSAILPIGTAHAQLFSPGSLSNDHKKWEGDANCGKCHAEGKRIGNDLCLNCHTELAARYRAGKGLHGLQYRGQSCSDCHGEHLGRGADLIRWPGGKKEKLNHSLTGWALRGKHKEEKCASCHKRKDGSFLGLQNQCGSCHEDSHEGRFGKACATCHSETGWKSVRIGSSNFDHDKTRFPLVGKHQGQECAKCHGDPPAYKGILFGDCIVCHKDEHDGRFAKRRCASCHVETGFNNFAKIRRRHPGVALKGGHKSVSCASCHTSRLDVAPPKGSACVSCHKPVHEAPFGRQCEDCHSSMTWLGLPSRLGYRVHNRTDFPLVGAHAEVECVKCHLPKLPRNKRFRGLEYDECQSCHDDPHNWAFIQKPETKIENDCATCHSERAFRPASFGVELHAQTSFPLDGMHQSVPCLGCHSQARPRHDFRVRKQECADCHENPHGNQFEKEMRAGGCASCHSTVGFAQPNIDHSIWPLTGAHLQASCDACHSPTDEDRKRGKGASYRGLPRECAGCHQDVHAGQFVLTPPQKQCDSCHTPDGFVVINFPHEQQTGFALDGEHAPLECNSCHRVEKLKDGSETERWRLGYDQCADCHANPHVDPKEKR